MVVKAAPKPPANGVVTFQYEGATWRLCMDVNALCALEAEVGDRVELARLFANDPDDLPELRTIRAALWSGLQAHHEEVSLLDAGRMIQALGLPVLGGKIGQAIIADFPGATARPRKAARKTD